MKVINGRFDSNSSTMDIIPETPLEEEFTRAFYEQHKEGFVIINISLTDILTISATKSTW
jgi:hypothetical protein